MDCPNFTNWLAATKEGIMTQCSSKDIFNVDETGLFCRIQSGRSFMGSEEKTVEGKVDKARVTLLAE